MIFNRRLWTSLVLIFLTVAIGCKSTDKVNNASGEESSTKEKALSPADLAQLRDTHKLNPDAAIVSGLVVEIVGNSNNDFTFKVGKLEKKGFGFSNQLRSGEVLSIIAGKKGGDLKQGQSVLMVISAFKKPGAGADQFLLEKVLAAMPGQ